MARTRIWQSFRFQSDPPQFDRRVKRFSIEPKEILCTGLKSYFVTKYLVGGLVLVHGMSLMECRIPNTNIPCESDHWLNVMTGLYCVLNKTLAIYVARQMIPMYHEQRYSKAALKPKSSIWFHGQIIGHNWSYSSWCNDCWGVYNGISLNLVLLTIEDDYHLR